MQQHPWFSEMEEALIRPGRPFVKMHGLRNDFIIVDGRKQPYRPSVEGIVRICDRREGVGGGDHVMLAQLLLRKTVFE